MSTEDLLSDIKSGIRLRPTVTNDRSSPVVKAENDPQLRVVTAAPMINGGAPCAPPPPPPPGPPPPPMSTGGFKLSGGGDGRNKLLEEIRGGRSLRKAVTIDKSSPIIDKNENSVDSRQSSVSQTNSASSSAPSMSMMNGPIGGGLLGELKRVQKLRFQNSVSEEPPEESVQPLKVTSPEPVALKPIVVEKPPESMTSSAPSNETRVVDRISRPVNVVRPVESKFVANHDPEPAISRGVRSFSPKPSSVPNSPSFKNLASRFESGAQESSAIPKQAFTPPVMINSNVSQKAKVFSATANSADAEPSAVKPSSAVVQAHAKTDQSTEKRMMYFEKLDAPTSNTNPNKTMYRTHVSRRLSTDHDRENSPPPPIPSYSPPRSPEIGRSAAAKLARGSSPVSTFNPKHVAEVIISPSPTLPSVARLKQQYQNYNDLRTISTPAETIPSQKPWANNTTTSSEKLSARRQNSLDIPELVTSRSSSGSSSSSPSSRPPVSPFSRAVLAGSKQANGESRNMSFASEKSNMTHSQEDNIDRLFNTVMQKESMVEDIERGNHANQTARDVENRYKHNRTMSNDRFESGGRNNSSTVQFVNGVATTAEPMSTNAVSFITNTAAKPFRSNTQVSPSSNNSNHEPPTHNYPSKFEALVSGSGGSNSLKSQQGFKSHTDFQSDYFGRSAIAANVISSMRVPVNQTNKKFDTSSDRSNVETSTVTSTNGNGGSGWKTTTTTTQRYTSSSMPNGTSNFNTAATSVNGSAVPKAQATVKPTLADLPASELKRIQSTMTWRVNKNQLNGTVGQTEFASNLNETLIEKLKAGRKAVGIEIDDEGTASGLEHDSTSMDQILELFEKIRALPNISQVEVNYHNGKLANLRLCTASESSSKSGK